MHCIGRPDRNWDAECNSLTRRLTESINTPKLRNAYAHYNPMDAETMRILTKGLTIAIGGFAPALAIGRLVAKAMEAIGRNPESAGKLFVPMLLGAAFAEAIAIYALVVSFTI